MRVLVTGAGGFIGAHLCPALAREGIETIAIGRNDSRARDRVGTFFAVEGIPERAALADILSRSAPDVVFHLAGSDRASSLAELYRINVFYCAALIEALRAARVTPKIIIAGSAAEYGAAAGEGQRLNEADRPSPINAYGETKLAQTVHAMRQSDLPVVVARIFNPLGEGLPSDRAVPSFIQRIKALGPGGGTIETGSLDGVRDIADIADVTRALVQLAIADVPTGEIYNVCTGKGARMSEVTQTLRDLLPYPVRFQPNGEGGGANSAVGDPSRLAAYGIHVAAPDLADVLGRMLLSVGIEERRAMRQ